MVIIPTRRRLLTLIIGRRSAMMFLFILVQGVSPGGCTSENVNAILTLRSVLIRTKYRIHGVTRLNVIRKGHSRKIITKEPHRVGTFLQIIQNRHSRDINITSHGTHGRSVPIVIQIISKSSHIITSRFSKVTQNNRLFNCVTIISYVTNRATPVSRTSKQTLRRYRSLKLQLITRAILLRFVRVLINRRVSNPNVFKRLDLRYTLRLPQTKLLRHSANLSNESRGPMAIGTRGYRVLRSTAIEICHANSSFLRHEGFHLRVRRSMTITYLNLQVLPRLTFTTQDRRNQCHGRNSGLICCFLCRVSFLFSEFLHLFLFAMNVTCANRSNATGNMFLVVGSSTYTMVMLSIRTMICNIYVLIFQTLRFGGSFGFNFYKRTPIVRNGHPVNFQIFVHFCVVHTILTYGTSAIIAPIRLRISSSGLRFTCAKACRR